MSYKLLDHSPSQRAYREEQFKKSKNYLLMIGCLISIAEWAFLIYTKAALFTTPAVWYTLPAAVHLYLEC